METFGPQPWRVEQPVAEAWPGEAATRGEHSTSLSPEPWAVPEPEMWRPPPPRRKRGRVMPLVLSTLGVALLATLAVAVILWPKDDDGGGTTGGSVSSQQSQQPTESPSAEPSTGQDSDAAAAKDQATQVNALLNDMASTRSQLGGVVESGCQTSDLEEIRSQRKNQLRAAQALQLDALNGGTELKNSLVTALEASVESNGTYLEAAPGCPSEDSVSAINDRANSAKQDVIRYWRPIAEEQGFSTPSADTI